MDVICVPVSDTCPVFLSSKCVFYKGDPLVNTGIGTNDNLQVALEKIDAAIGSSGTGGGAGTSGTSGVSGSSGTSGTTNYNLDGGAADSNYGGTTLINGGNS